MSRKPDEPFWVVIVTLVIAVLLASCVVWYTEANDCEYNAATKILDCPEKSDDD